jgi:isopropylmalate/homocitrate/citramalate synthase
MAHAEEVLQLVEHRDTTRHAGLVLNSRGCDRFLASPADQAHLVVYATNTFSVKNANVPAVDAIASAIESAKRVAAVGRKAVVAIAVAFGCPFSGRVDPAVVRDLAAELISEGVHDITLADTIGVAAPREVARLVGSVIDLGARVGVHLHNTRSSGYANAIAALEAGATTVDSSVGGTGGCPFAPAASGNIATEDLVYILERDGIETGLDLDALVETARWLERELDRPLPGMVHRAGTAP